MRRCLRCECANWHVVGFQFFVEDHAVVDFDYVTVFVADVEDDAP